jgi:hypothetical protein
MVGFHESADDEGFVVLALLPPEEEVLVASEPPPHAVTVAVSDATITPRRQWMHLFSRFMQRIVGGGRGVH